MKRIPYLTLAATLLVALLAACGSNNNKSSSAANNSQNVAKTSANNSACATGQGNNGNGATVKIGSKAFAEEELLATMTKLVLEKHNFKVDYTTKAADPAIDQALRSGTIDMLWQYTGTELQQFLKIDQPPTDLQQAFDLAKEKFE